MKLFVRNITFEATTDDLRALLVARGYGVAEVKVVVSPEDGRSRGFGFVTFADSRSYVAALNDLEGAEFMGRPLHVMPARDKPRGSEAGRSKIQRSGARGQRRETGRSADKSRRRAGGGDDYGWGDT
jgi:cold-inducible RNA-binding protein